MKDLQKPWGAIREFFRFQTMKSQVVAGGILFAALILFVVHTIVASTVTSLVENHMTSRLISDIEYIQDLIKHDATGEDVHWGIKDGFICYGDVLIGDGTEETANLEPFLEHNAKTSTFAYVFILDEDARLGYVESEGDALGYSEGRYLRVAGSTRGPSGESIVGTYMARDVSDALDKHGYYHGEANVAGGLIYCYYKTLLDDRDEIVGAMVVGRFISELKSEIVNSVQKINIVTIIAIIACVLLAVKMLATWLDAIKKTTKYLEQIEGGALPDEKLILPRKNEMSTIADSINKMVASLRENKVLRKMSKTDALTNLANRFALDDYSVQLEKSLSEKPRYIAVEIVDVDCFKQYNDNYGHQAGDRCIVGVAEEFGALIAMNENIFACRYGGDEFLLIYTGYKKKDIEHFVTLLRKQIQSRRMEHRFSEVSNIVTLTQGVAFGMFESGQTIAQYLKCADRALYEAKKAGRDGFKILNLADTPELVGFE